MEEKIFCAYCQQEKSIIDFYKGNKRRCKVCTQQYQAEYRARNPEKYAYKPTRRIQSADSDIKQKCISCLEVKPIEHFGRGKSQRYTDRKNRCKECESFLERQKRKARQERREQEKEREREALLSLTYQERINIIDRKLYNKQLKRVYGIPIERYDEMLRQQNGVCAICHNPPDKHEKLVVDHNHTTGHIRGLLCKHCNWGLGNFKDSPENLINAAKYLKNSTWDEQTA